MSPARYVVSALLLLTFATAPHANQCYGTIDALYVDSAGNVLIDPSFRNGWLQICNAISPWNGIDPVTCKTWIALATTLRVTREQAVVSYSATIACDALPAYGAAPGPAYVMYYVP